MDEQVSVALTLHEVLRIGQSLLNTIAAFRGPAKEVTLFYDV